MSGLFQEQHGNEYGWKEVNKSKSDWRFLLKSIRVQVIKHLQALVETSTFSPCEMEDI